MTQTTIVSQATHAELLPWHDENFLKNPGPWYDRILQDHPLMLVDGGGLVLSRYADVMKWGKHPTLVSVPPDGIGDSPWAANLESVLLTEGEQHSQLRRTFSSWLTPKAVRQWATTAAETAAAALDGIGPNGLIEAHRALGVQPAQDAMAHALGVPRQDGFQYIHATNLTMMTIGSQFTDEDVRRAHEGFGFMMFQAEALIEAKRRNPGDGMLLDEMIKAVDEGRLSERSLKEHVQILWGSAAHNPGHVIASALVDFANLPEIFSAYKDDADSREAILNEVIRRSLPEIALDRFTTEPLQIHDIELPPKTPIRLLLGAALRDPEVFPNADEFDYKRPKEASMSLAFGLGTHNCVGQALARAEARAVLDVVAERYDQIDIIGEPTWVISDRHRNCEGLTVRFS